MDEQDDELGLSKKIEPWVYRLYGLVALCTAIWGLFIDAQGFSDRLYNVIFFTFGATIAVGLLVHLPIFIIIMALNVASREKNPIVQGISFGFFIFIILCILDLVTGGSFLVHPIFSIIFSGSLEGTYWQCENWVSYDTYEGGTRYSCAD